MRKHSVALIQHYYGKLPNYFPLWLKSAGFNKNFDFIFFTDTDFSGYNVPDNVHVIHMTFDELKARIAEHLDFEFVCDTPYKACDYILMHGLIFQDYLKDYEFWGTCDPDMIWGDMSRFITPDILDKYDRFYRFGHLQFFRNTESVKTFALHELPGWGISYRDVFRTHNHIAFEETILIEHLFSRFADEGDRQYWSDDYADISPCYRQFLRTRNFNETCEAIPAFRWKNGKLLGLSVDGKNGNDIEYLYVHLQKRAMNFTPGLENEDSFMIIPNEFVKDHELMPKETADLMRHDSGYYRKNKHGLLYYVRQFSALTRGGNI